MPKEQKSNMSSTTKAENGNTASGNLLTESPTQWSYHSLLLNDFIDQIESETVNDEHYHKFFDSIKDKQGKYIQKLEKEITLLESKYNIVMLAVTYFSALKELGSKEFDPEVMTVISQHMNIRPTDSIEIILGRAGKFITDLDVKRNELKKMTPTEGVKVDRSYFTHLIITVAKHMKYFIDKRLVTVPEFAAMINDMQTENEVMEKQAKLRNHAR